MKKIISILMVMVAFIMNIFSFSLMSPVKAASTWGISEVDLYSKGEVVYFYYGDIGVGVEVTMYRKDGVEYPAYCINKGKQGVTKDHTYTVDTSKLVSNVNVWRAVVNGYPYKTLEELGCKTMQEAYAATKMAVYDSMYNYDIEKFRPHEEGNASHIRTVNAIKKIITAARNSTERKETAVIGIKSEDKEWKVDDVDSKYVSRTYFVEASASHENYTIQIENDKNKIIKVVDIKNKQKNTFSTNEKFKILLPINELEENGEFTIKAVASLKTMPVLYGKTPNPDWQNFAVTAGMYELTDAKLKQSYFKNNTQIEIVKKDGEKETPLEGAVFNLEDERENVIYTDLTSDKNGKIQIENLLPGKYYLKEVLPPEGYTTYGNSLEINVKLNEKIVVTVKNFEKPEEPQEEKPQEENHVTVGEKKVEETLPRTGF